MGNGSKFNGYESTSSSFRLYTFDCRYHVAASLNLHYTTFAGDILIFLYRDNGRGTGYVGYVFKRFVKICPSLVSSTLRNMNDVRSICEMAVSAARRCRGVFVPGVTVYQTDILEGPEPHPAALPTRVLSAN